MFGGLDRKWSERLLPTPPQPKPRPLKGATAEIKSSLILNQSLINYRDTKLYQTVLFLAKEDDISITVNLTYLKKSTFRPKKIIP